MKKEFIIVMACLLLYHFAKTQQCNIILGRPMNTTVTASILFDQAVQFYFEYGEQSGVYSNSTSAINAVAGKPEEIDIAGLLPDKKYFYRARYKAAGAPSFSTTPEYSFHTQRGKGSVFSFTIEADPHLDSNTDSAAYLVTLKHMLTKKPDFLIDLGDNFMVDKMPVINQTEITNRNLLFRRFYNEVCPSAPLYLVLGNHEGEYSWVPNNTNSSMPVMATNTRKLFYPNPFPNSFYSGNSTPETLVGLRENYFSWEWGDALFIVLDPYWHTTTKSEWGWTLGKTQYDWLKQVISSSTAKFKFVFCHQLVSGNGIEGRGGSESVPFYEMGGKNTDGSNGFATNRPGWDKPVHDLLKEYNCNIFFHGHDHLFAKQDLDGIVYQEVPQPSAINVMNITGTEPGYGYANGLLLPNRGYMLVTVSADSVKVDYVRTYLPAEENATRHNGDIAYSYIIKKANGNSVINNQELVKVYPNPVNTKLTVTFLTNVTNKQCRLISTAGTTILTTNAGEIDVSKVSSGVYFLDIQTNEFRVSKKITIVH